jgi:hypothetical protein
LFDFLTRSTSSKTDCLICWCIRHLQRLIVCFLRLSGESAVVCAGDGRVSGKSDPACGQRARAVGEANKKTAAAKRQLTVFRSSLSRRQRGRCNCSRLRFRDTNPKRCTLCIQTVGKASVPSPDDFGDLNVLKHSGLIVSDPPRRRTFNGTISRFPEDRESVVLPGGRDVGTSLSGASRFCLWSCACLSSLVKCGSFIFTFGVVSSLLIMSGGTRQRAMTRRSSVRC